MSIDITKKIAKVTVDGQEMPLAGVDVYDTTATADDVRVGKTFYSAEGEKTDGTLATYSGSTEVTPTAEEQILETAGKVVESNIVVGAAAPSTIIKAAELANVDFVLKNSNDQQVGTASTGTDGGEVSFSVAEAGTYKLYAYSAGALLWSDTDVVVEKVGAPVVVPTAKSLDDYTWGQIHTACDKGFAHTMFKIGTVKTNAGLTGDLAGVKVFIEDIVTVAGKDYIDWRAAASKYLDRPEINVGVPYVKTSSSNSWVRIATNNGGYKYSYLRHLMMKQGEAVYTVASSILPADYSGTLVTGIKADQIYYTDQNGAKSKLYDYNKATDTFVETTSATYSDDTTAKNTCRFVKGYFKPVGTITQAVFNAGYYYTREMLNYSPVIFTRATTYSSSATYYGFYETLQEDGAIVAGLASLSQYLVRKAIRASAGFVSGTESYVSEMSDFANVPAVEEMLGVNRETVLPQGIIGNNVGVYSVPGEAEKLKVYDDFAFLPTQTSFVTRSAGSSGIWMVMTNGKLDTTSTDVARATRVGFRTC